MGELIQVPLETLSLDADRQVRERLDEDALRDYTDAYTAGGAEALDPPQGYRDATGAIWLWDGYTRATAAKLAGLVELPVLVEPGTRQGALVRALCEANRKHGARLQPRDLRRKAELALQVEELASLSNVQLAERIGVNRETIRQVRHELEARGEAAAVAVTTADGKTRGTSNRRAVQPPVNPDPSPSLVELLKGLPDDLELDVDGAVELPLEQRAQRVSVWRFTIGYRVMSAASLAQLEALARAADEEMRARAAAPPPARRPVVVEEDEQEDSKETPAEAGPAPDARRPLLDPQPFDVFATYLHDKNGPYLQALTVVAKRAGDRVWLVDLLRGGKRNWWDVHLPLTDHFSDVRIVQTAVPSSDVAGGWDPPPGGYDYALSRNAPAADLRFPRAPDHLLPVGHEASVAATEGEAAPPAAERRADSRARGERVAWAISRLRELRKRGCPEILCASPADHEAAAPKMDDESLAQLERGLRSGLVLVKSEEPGGWSICDLATMEVRRDTAGAVLVWKDREAAEVALDLGTLQAWESTAENTDALQADLGKIQDSQYQDLIGELPDHEVATIIGVEVEAIAAWREAHPQPAQDATEPQVPAPDVEAVAVCRGCGPVDVCDEDRCCLTCGGDLVLLADAASLEIWTQWMEEMAEASAAAPDPARDAIAHQDARPVPGARAGEIWLPLDATVEAIAAAVEETQARCRKHLADPQALAARVRRGVDRILHTAALWDVSVDRLQPFGQWADLPPKNKDGVHPDTTVVEFGGQGWTERPPEGITAPALLFFRGGLRSSGQEGVVELRAPRQDSAPV